MKNIPDKYYKLCDYMISTGSNDVVNGAKVKASDYYRLENNISYLLGNYYPQPSGIGGITALSTSPRTYRFNIVLPPVCKYLNFLFITGMEDNSDEEIPYSTIEITGSYGSIAINWYQGIEIQTHSRLFQVSDPTIINKDVIEEITINCYTDKGPDLDNTVLYTIFYTFIPLDSNLP